MNIPLCLPSIGDSEIEEVTRVLRSNQLSLGPVLTRFEEQFASYIGTKYAVAASSGTAALHMGVRAMGLGQGNEVLTTSFSFVASANCLLFETVRPRFIDIDRDTLNLDTDLLRDFLSRKCRRNRRGELIDVEAGLIVKGILPVHVFGLPAEMDVITELAEEYDLWVLEDACEAIGAEYKGRRVGTFGDAAVFAFYPNKQMTTGEGGMIVTDDPDLAAQCRSLRNQGRDADGRWLKHTTLGYNYRLSELHCALGCAQLSRIDTLLDARNRVAREYMNLLGGRDFLRLPYSDSDSTRSWFVFVIQVAADSGAQCRDNIRIHLEKAGIASQAYFPAIHRQPYFAQAVPHLPGELPATEQASDSCIALPFFPALASSDIQRVVETVLDACDAQGLSARLISVH